MSITAKRPESYVDFCEDLSLRSVWEAATEALDAARRNQTERLVDSTLVDAAQRVRDIEAQMDAVTVRIKIRALARKQWHLLAAAHPPRPDIDQDQNLNVNSSTFFDALAAGASVPVGDGVVDIPPSIFAAVEKVSGEVRDFDPKTEWVPLADEMTNGQYGEFVDKFLEVNRQVVGAPFSRAASLLTTGSEQK